MGHHRFVVVNLAIEVTDPATTPATTSDATIKKGLKDSLVGFTATVDGKPAKTKVVRELP